MGVMEWIIVGSLTLLIGGLIDKLVDARQKIKKLEQRVGEWKNTSSGWEDNYSQEAKRTRRNS